MVLWAVLVACGGSGGGMKGNSLEGDFVDAYGLEFDRVEVEVTDTVTTDGEPVQATTLLYVDEVDSDTRTDAEETALLISVRAAPVAGESFPMTNDGFMESDLVRSPSTDLDLDLAAGHMDFNEVELELDGTVSGTFHVEFTEDGSGAEWFIDGTFKAPIVALDVD